MRGKAVTAAAIAALALAGCSGSDDSYSQEQLDLAVKRAKQEAREAGFEQGLQEGEARAVKRAGMADADGWWYLKMNGGELPAAGQELAAPVSRDFAIYVCDFGDSLICGIDPETGDSVGD